MRSIPLAHVHVLWNNNSSALVQIQMLGAAWPRGRQVNLTNQASQESCRSLYVPSPRLRLEQMSPVKAPGSASETFG